MVHVIFFVYTTSFVAGKDLVYGGLQQMEKEMSQRKYSMKLERDGYSIPDVGHWHMVEVRIKKEVVADFIADLGAINLYPVNNKASLWKIFRAKKLKDNCEVKDRIPAKQLLFVQWCFKILNKLGLSPFQPAPVSDKVPEAFAPKAWKYVVVAGVRPDPTEKTTYFGDHPDTL